MKASDYIVSFLKQKGITEFFGYQGTMIAHLVDSIERMEGVNNHSSYHEQGAAFAACGYAQASGSCAACYATSGPGAINLLSGVANAYYDSQPVIFFTGQLNTYEYSGIEGLRQQGFQETNIVSMASSVTKYVKQIWDPKELPLALHEAWEAANTGRRGPVLIDLPMNVQRGEIDSTPEQWEAAYALSHQEKSQDDPDEREGENQKAKSAALAIASALQKASRPVLLIGGGADQEACNALIALAREHSLPIVTSVLRRDILCLEDDTYFGCLGGAYGHRSANMITSAKADLLISFGMSLCTRQTGTKTANFAPQAKILRVDIDPYTLQRKLHPQEGMEEGFEVDASLVAKALLEQPLPSFESWKQICLRIKEALSRVDDETPERSPNRCISALGGALSHVSALAVDIGQHMVWTYQSFPNQAGMQMLFSGGHGAMGYGLPAAIGAYYALKHPVACICGDGGFQMNIQELEWVVRDQLPIKIVVMNNHALGMIRHLQTDYFDHLFAGTCEVGGFASPDFTSIARAYGLEAATVSLSEFEQTRSLPEKVCQLLSQEGPALIQVQMEPATFAYPKTCLGEGIHNQQPYVPKEVFEELMAL